MAEQGNEPIDEGISGSDKPVLEIEVSYISAVPEKSVAFITVVSNGVQKGINRNQISEIISADFALQTNIVIGWQDIQ